MYFIDMSMTTVLQNFFLCLKIVHLLSKKILCAPHYPVLAEGTV